MRLWRPKQRSISGGKLEKFLVKFLQKTSGLERMRLSSWNVRFWQSPLWSLMIATGSVHTSQALMNIPNSESRTGKNYSLLAYNPTKLCSLMGEHLLKIERCTVYNPKKASLCKATWTLQTWKHVFKVAKNTQYAYGKGDSCNESFGTWVNWGGGLPTIWCSYSTWNNRSGLRFLEHITLFNAVLKTMRERLVQ